MTAAVSGYCAIVGWQGCLLHEEWLGCCSSEEVKLFLQFLAYTAGEQLDRCRTPVSGYARYVEHGCVVSSLTTAASKTALGC